jgi:hypothetical protein
LLEGWVHRSGARPPGTVASAFELLDDLVPVRWLLGQEHEDRGPDVAPRGATAGAERRTEGRAESTWTAEAGGEVRGVEGRPSTPMATTGATLEVLADMVVEAGCRVVVRRRPLVTRGVVGMSSGHFGSLRSG